ncbi:MAG: NAD(P)H-hydrate dehydratase, partial [Glaciihabitans sp.]|nr:NAD(P)H-hydrate dehydratase [Glaciihabitans sp.]
MYLSPSTPEMTMSTPTESTPAESTPAESIRPELWVTPNLLGDWPLPDPSGGESKYDRGQVVVVGGASTSPGAAMLAGIAALRMGA